MPEYGVFESAGLLDDLIFIIKQDGVASEQELRVLLQEVSSGSNGARRG